MCSLDAEKAFDSCHWDILFTKLLREKKIPVRIIRLIASLYKKGSASVAYNGHISEVFHLSQGVRQGSVLSPYLYNLYYDKLLESLNGSSIGTKLYDRFTGIIMYADDIILLSPTLSGLQNLLGQCQKYSEQHGIVMNAGKTAFLTSGPRIFVDLNQKR